VGCAIAQESAFFLPMPSVPPKGVPTNAYTTRQWVANFCQEELYDGLTLNVTINQPFTKWNIPAGTVIQVSVSRLDNDQLIASNADATGLIPQFSIPYKAEYGDLVVTTTTQAAAGNVYTLSLEFVTQPDQPLSSKPWTKRKSGSKRSPSPLLNMDDIVPLDQIVGGTENFVVPTDPYVPVLINFAVCPPGDCGHCNRKRRIQRHLSFLVRDGKRAALFYSIFAA